MNAAEWLLPLLVLTVLVHAQLHRVNTLDAFVAGVQDALHLIYHLAPYIIAIFVALELFTASGALDLLARFLHPALVWLHLPYPLLPLLIVRPLSGSASLGVISQILRSYGPDSLVGRMACIMQGSSDTTFYVLTVYTGAGRVQQAGYALPVAILGDLVGYAVAIYLAYHWPF